MEQLEHIFRRTQCAWYNVGKLEEVCKKVEKTTEAIYARLKPTEEETTVEELSRLVDDYCTLERLVSEFQWTVRVTGTMLTAIPIGHDSETLMNVKTLNYAQKQCSILAQHIFQGGQKLNPSLVFLLQRKLFVVYLELVRRDVDSFLAKFNNPAWITTNCSEERRRQNVLVYVNLLIEDVKALLETPPKYTEKAERKLLKSTIQIELSEALRKVSAMGPVKSPEVRENMEGGESAEKTVETKNMEGGESAEETVETENEESEVTHPEQLADKLWLQFLKSFFVYRTLWIKFVFCRDSEVTKEVLPEKYAKMEDEQRKLSFEFDELSTNFPDGEKSSKLDIFKSDMELLFRKTHVFYRTAKESFWGNDRLVSLENEFTEHSESVRILMYQLQKTESIKFEELEEYRVFIDSEICFLNSFLFLHLEDYVAACQRGQTPVYVYKAKHFAILHLLKTCEWLKYFLNLESTVFCNNPLWNKLLCDGRRIALENAGLSRKLSAQLVRTEEMVSFVLENGVIKESENIENVVDTVFRPHWVIRKVSLEFRKKVPAETLLNLLMRKLEKSASKEAAEYAFDQLGLMGTFTRDRLMSVFPADSPVLKHLLGHLPKPVEEIPEQGQDALQMVQKALENVQKVSEKIQKVAEQVKKVPDSSPKNPAGRTVRKVAAVGKAHGALVVKKNAVTISMPDVKPNIKANNATVVKKEVETSLENDNIGSKHVTTDFNWYSNFPPGSVPFNSEVEASPRNSKNVSHNDNNTASGVVVTDWCNNVRTIPDMMDGTMTKKNANTSGNGFVGSIPQTSVGVNTISKGVAATNVGDSHIASSNDNIASSNDNIASSNDNIASSNYNTASSNVNPSQPAIASEISDTITFRDVVEALYKRPIAM